MIDTHCHLEQKDYDNDRDDVIERCKNEMNAVVTCAPDPRDYNISFKMVKDNPGFVFLTAGVHPQYVNRFVDSQIEDAMETLRKNSNVIVGVGETGLDYSHITDVEGREKQRMLFTSFIKLAKELNKPLVVHIRNGKDDVDAFEQAIEILEKNKVERVQLHMFGCRKLLDRVIENGYYVSSNAIILRSKSYSKVVRDTPIERLMLETDSPWIHPNGKPKHEERNDPTFVKDVATKVAEIKGLSVDEVDKITTENAIKFFNIMA